MKEVYVRFDSYDDTWITDQTAIRNGARAFEQDLRHLSLDHLVNLIMYKLVAAKITDFRITIDRES